MWFGVNNFTKKTLKFSTTIKIIWWICWHAVIILKLCTRKERKQWNLKHWIKKILLMNFVTPVIRISTCFPGISSDRNDFGSFSSRMVSNTFVNNLRRWILDHIFHNRIYSVDPRWKMFKSDISCWISDWLQVKWIKISHINRSFWEIVFKYFHRTLFMVHFFWLLNVVLLMQVILFSLSYTIRINSVSCSIILILKNKTFYFHWVVLFFSSLSLIQFKQPPESVKNRFGCLCYPSWPHSHRSLNILLGFSQSRILLINESFLQSPLLVL